MQTVLLHIEELENENMKKNLYFGVKNTKNLFYVRNSIHVLFRNIFHPKNESMLLPTYNGCMEGLEHGFKAQPDYHAGIAQK